jgi:4-hydroxythreonine-4-phosphate dehydrogenase
VAAPAARRGVRGIQTLNTPRIALTSGEPAGVGPEICLAAALEAFDCELVCLADRELLAGRASLTGSRISLSEYDAASPRPHAAGHLSVLHQPLAAPCSAGKLAKANARYVLGLLDRAIAGARSGEFAAIVTAPVHKGVINDSGVRFSGHTEYLAERTGTPLPVMMLAAGSLRVALATTHLPLREVSDAITTELLCDVIAIIDRDLRRWGITAPRIGVCGLNPHAGEGGYLGDEEIRVIHPAVEQMKARGVAVSGPLPADTLFVARIAAGYDAILSMYHDQGLPVIKHAAFDRAVNVTLGLPILRTSVDHGTALDLAGTGKADASSLVAAIRLAIELAGQLETAA